MFVADMKGYNTSAKETTSDEKRRNFLNQYPISVFSGYQLGKPGC